jgi:hypothetical protein
MKGGLRTTREQPTGRRTKIIGASANDRDADP